jgi:hypothetical protein
VIAAAQTGFLHEAVVKRCTAVLAELLDTADAALRVAEHDEVFAQNIHTLNGKLV